MHLCRTVTELLQARSTHVWCAGPDSSLLRGGILFALLLDLHVVTHRTAKRRAGDCMVPCDVSADATDCGTAKTSGREARSDGKQRYKREGFQDEHSDSPSRCWGGEQVAVPHVWRVPQSVGFRNRGC